jgi:hypothetical protein
LVDADASIITSGAETLVWGIVTTYLPADSTLTWSDGTIRDLHQIDKFALSAGLTGTGLADYDGSTVKSFSAIYRNIAGDEGPMANLKTKVIEIGNWNMDTTASVSIAHGLAIDDIRSVDFIVRSDDGLTRYTNAARAFGATLSVYIASITATNINLMRDTGSAVDDPAWDDSPYNRGWITVNYVVS